MSITVLYFARLREELDCESETLSLGEEQPTVADLVRELSHRGPRWQNAFANKFIVAVNHEVGNLRSPIKRGDEVAFYPPVTGG